MSLFDKYTIHRLIINLKENGRWILKVTVLWVLFSASCTQEDFVLPTFLEKNDGSEWVLQNDDLIVYIRLNNDQEHLIEQWSFDPSSACFEYNPNIFSPGYFEIRENTPDRLIILGDMVLSDFECLTITRKDNILTAHFLICEWQEESAYFTVSPVQVDSLIKCP